jgi:ABC-type Fe3+/spermidine/putrescine transport system ATPase subunit
VTLALQGLSKTHPGQPHPALANLSLTLPRGSLTALLGPSGSGKSTVLKLIAGLLEPDAGTIHLNDRPLLGLPPERRGVVMVFQNAPLFPHMTLAENVGFGLRMRGLPAPQVTRRVAEMLDRVQLQGLGPRRPGELSGGQAQRGALARALILDPALLLLDEPLSSLDASLRDEMQSLIRRLQRETGVTTLVVTHDQTEAMVLADRIALLFDGRLAQAGPPDQVFTRPASLAVARFFGAENFLPGSVRAGGFDCALGHLPLAEVVPDGPGTLTIRPEALRLGPGPDARPARVRASAFLGTQSRVELDVGGQPLVALVPPDTARGLTAGAEIGVTLPTHALWVIRPPA